MSTKDACCSTRFTLRAVPPYDFTLTAHKPAGWSLLTPFEIFDDDKLWTAMRTPSSEEAFGLKLQSVGTVNKPEVLCEVYSGRELGASAKKEMADNLSWTLNLNEDIRQFYTLAEHDPLIRVLVRDLYGMRITKRSDIFPRLILAVTLQMAPIKRSDQMMNLLIREYGEKIAFDGREVLYWPSPRKVAAAGVRELEERCKLGYRAKALRGIAEAVCKSFPTLRELGEMSAKEAKIKLMGLRGIGEYSADIVSPHPGFALDVWSANIFNLLLFGKKAESPRKAIPKLRRIADNRWGRWKGYVFIYVLNDLDNLSREFNLNLTGL